MSPAFTLYGYRGSSNSDRVTLMLLDAGFTDYELVITPPGESLKTPEHLLRHPFAKIPAMVTSDGFKLFESRAICTYLARTHNFPLIPHASDTKATALFEQAQSIEMCYFSDPATRISRELFVKPVYGFGVTDEAVVASAKVDLERWADGVERILEGQEQGFMAGKEFSLVDIYYIPLIKRLEDCGLLEIVLGKEKIRAWWNRCLERPALKKWAETAVTKKTIMEMLAKRKADAEAKA